jgi:uncharacterized protein (DUF362 family)
MIHDSPHRLNRRDFVRTVSAGLAVFPMLDARGFAQGPAPRRSRVALVQTSDRKRGVAEILKLLNPQGISGKRVVLKPNFNTADDPPGSTHNDTLAQLVTELHERGARTITLGESSARPTREVMEKKGIFDLGRDLRFDIVDYEQNTDNDWVSLQGAHWPEGFSLPRLITSAEYVVITPCVKTHKPLGVYTMSLKLAVGLTPKPIRRPMHQSPDGRRMIAELNTGYKPNLIVMDGVAGNGRAEGGQRVHRGRRPDCRRCGRAGPAEIARRERSHHEPRHLRAGTDRARGRVGARGLRTRLNRDRHGGRGEPRVCGHTAGHPREGLSSFTTEGRKQGRFRGHG